MCILSRDYGLEQFEQQAEWGLALNYCENRWKNDPSNCELLLRLMSQAWNMCAYFDQQPLVQCKSINIKEDFDCWLNVIHFTANYGDLHFSDDSRYLCLTGYMMNVLPEWFVQKGLNYKEVQESGLKRLQSVPHSKDDECSVFSDVFLRGLNVNDDILEQMFPGTSEVNMYFRSIMANRH